MPSLKKMDAVDVDVEKVQRRAKNKESKSNIPSKNEGRRDLGLQNDNR